MKKVYFIFILLVAGLGQSCKKLVEVGTPKTQLTTDKVFANDQTAIAVVYNIYASFNTLIYGNLGPAFGTYSDELSTTSPNLTDMEYHHGWVSTGNGINLNLWQSFYSVIYGCNGVLENLDRSVGISDPIKKQLRGELLFLRSFTYFFLVNIYGEVPLLLTTDVRKTATAGRASVESIYSRIFADLEEAKSALTDAYPGTERVRVNRQVVRALLARVYLFRERWENAETEASAVIASGFYHLNEDLRKVFQANSSETILEFWTREGFTTVGPLWIPSTGAVPTYPLTPTLLQSFEPNDSRRQLWIDSMLQSNECFYYPAKYRNTGTVYGIEKEYLIVLRLSEQYLIRAEARAHLNKVDEGKNDLNRVRQRADLPDSDAAETSSLLLDIEKERRKELFCEWGHRFFDLKRTGKADQLLSQIKPAWKTASILLPIPQYERLNNPNLSQNPGY